MNLEFNKSVFEIRRIILFCSFGKLIIHFVETKKLVDILVKNGFERSSLVPTGIPMYDDVFEILEKKIKRHG